MGGLGYGRLREGGELVYSVYILYCRCARGETALDPDGWAGLWQAERGVGWPTASVFFILGVLGDRHP